MVAFLNNPVLFRYLGLAGALFSICGSLISALRYRGKKGERYSPLNHFISELGEVGVSKLAWVFNLGLVLSGLSLVPACISLGLLLPGWLSSVGMVTGVITAIGLFMVGIFPMNKLSAHGIAAVIFFRGGLLMVLSFSLAILLQPANKPALPGVYSLAGVPAILSFGYFLYMMGKAQKSASESLDPSGVERPKFWRMPMAEWAIFITIVIWFIIIALGL